MSKKKTNYVVRGFNTVNENFSQPTGVMIDFGSYTERVVDKQFEAMSMLLGDPDIMTMSVPFIMEAGFDLVGDVDASRGSLQMFNVVDLCIGINSTDKHEIRALKSGLRETIKHWAEKSRVKGRRGYRSNAIRTPIFEYLGTETVMRVQIILSNAICYAHETVDVTPQDFNSVTADLALLRKKLNRDLGHMFNGLHYHHSLIGDGDVL